MNILLTIFSFLLNNNIIFMPSDNNFYISILNKNETYVMKMKSKVNSEVIWKGMYTLITDRDVVVISKTGSRIYTRKHFEKNIYGGIVKNNSLYLIMRDEVRILGLTKRIYIKSSTSIDNGVYKVSNDKVIRIDRKTTVYSITNDNLKKEFNVNIEFLDCVYYKGKIYGIKGDRVYIVDKKGNKKTFRIKKTKKIKTNKLGPIVYLSKKIYIINKKKFIFTGKKRVIGDDFISWTDGKKAYIYTTNGIDTIPARDLVIKKNNKILVFDGKKIYRYDRKETVLAFQIGSVSPYGTENYKKYGEFIPLIFQKENSFVKIRIGYFKEKYPLLKKIWKDGWFVYTEKKNIDHSINIDINKDGIKEVPLWNDSILSIWSYEYQYLTPLWTDSSLASVRIEDAYDTTMIVRTKEGWYQLKYDDTQFKLQPLE